MKSRIQLAGVPHGSKTKTLWTGEMPLLSGIPGMRMVLYSEKNEPVAYGFKQMCLEINTMAGDVEQVVYVVPVDRTTKPEVLNE